MDADCIHPLFVSHDLLACLESPTICAPFRPGQTAALGQRIMGSARRSQCEPSPQSEPRLPGVSFVVEARKCYALRKEMQTQMQLAGRCIPCDCKSIIHVVAEYYPDQ